MRRDRELIHRLLVKLEEWPSRPGDMFFFSGHEQELAIEGYSGEQIEYHLGILRAEGYVDSPGAQPMQGITFRSLTPTGHDLVDQYREALELQAAEKAVQESRNWIPAAEAVELLKSVFKSEHLARMTLCKRAHAGMILTRAERFVIAEKPTDNAPLPTIFWWAEGYKALTQNWRAGDFDTWVKSSELSRDLRLSAGKVHLEAFNVSFMRSGVEKLIPADNPAGALAPALSNEAIGRLEPTRNTGGRPKREYWEDLLIEIARQLYGGALQPKTQADIETAMHQWISAQGHDSGETAVRERARKVWRAIEKDEN